MNVLKCLPALLSCSILIVSRVDAASDGVEFVPSAGISVNKLRFERADGSVTHATYPALIIDFTASLGPAYLKVGGELFGQDFVREGDEIKSIERDDYTATLGIVLARKFSIFGGYTTSEMKDDRLGLFHQDSGYFGGLAYSLEVEKSNLALSLAYASQDGRILDEGTAQEENGKTRGLSYAVTWSGPFRQTMGYQVGARFRLYKFESTIGEVTEKAIGALFASVIF